MKRLWYVKFIGASVVLAATTLAGAENPPYPTILYGATTTLPPTSPFAVATTAPPADSPRAQYVVVAEVSAKNNLEVLAWHDTTTSLEPTPTPGLATTPGVTAVAIAGLDSGRVVTADVNAKGVLSIDTWTVGTAGVALQKGYSTGADVASPKVSIADLSSTEVVTAYETPAGDFLVEAWTIAENGLPAPKALLGKGPKSFEVSVAAVTADEVVTAAGDSSESLWVDTWAVGSGGVRLQDQVEVKTTVSKANGCYGVPQPETVAVGAGQSLKVLASGYALVQSAFTPVVNPDCDLEAYYWGISDSGVLTLTSTAAPNFGSETAQVSAAMLIQNVPITTYDGGIGFNHVFVEDYTEPNLLDSAPSYGDPYGVLSIASASAGSDFSYLSLFEPYSAYFVSAGQFNPEEEQPDGTVFIKVLSYPEPPIL